MSLDKFTGTKKKVKKSKPKSSTIKKKKSKEEPIKSELERKKYYLSCTVKCGYKRTLKKKKLSDEDFICRKCGKKMKNVKS